MIEFVAFVVLLVAAPVLRYYLVVAPKKRAVFGQRWKELNGPPPVEAVKAGAETQWQKSVREYAQGLKEAGEKLGGKR